MAIENLVGAAAVVAKPITLQLKVIFFSVVIGLISLMITSVVILHDKNESNKVLIQMANDKIADLQSSVGVLQADQSAFNIAQTAMKDAISANRKQQAILDKRLQEKEGTIYEKYKSLEDTPANQVAKEKELSQARITGVWETFCKSHTTHDKCQVSEK